MKFLRLTFLFLILTTSVSATTPVDRTCPQHVLKGAPVSKTVKKNDQYLCRANYAVHYRYDTRTAEWVAEHVTLESVTGKSKRRDDFRPDREIPAQHRAELKDYVGAGYDRGHLAPAGDNTQSDAVMSESFLLTNMVPQVPNHNRGIWKQLETYVRDWVIAGMDIYVVSGTVYQTGYKTIGDNQVGVPTHIWKVIVDRKDGKAIAFMFPHTALPVKDLPKYAVSVATLEKLTGINFMPKLTKAQRKMETAEPNLSLWPKLQ
jgi:endonuclease G, mitochondrial